MTNRSPTTNSPADLYSVIAEHWDRVTRRPEASSSFGSYVHKGTAARAVATLAAARLAVVGVLKEADWRARYACRADLSDRLSCKRTVTMPTVRRQRSAVSVRTGTNHRPAGPDTCYPVRGGPRCRHRADRRPCLANQDGPPGTRPPTAGPPTPKCPAEPGNLGALLEAGSNRPALGGARGMFLAMPVPNSGHGGSSVDVKVRFSRWVFGRPSVEGHSC